MSGKRYGFLWLMVLALFTSSPGAGQQPEPLQAEWVVQVGVGAANVLAGGLTTAMTAWIRGEDAVDAFLQGSVGGAVVYVGKRIATGRFHGAGLLGRQVGAVGSSVAANGGMGRGWIEQVWLPVGPLWIQASPASDHDLRLDLSSVIATAWAGTRPELAFDWRQSLSAGTAIFVAPEHEIHSGVRRVGGFALPGVAVLGPTRGEQVRAHEMIHVMQLDYLWQNVSRPLEGFAWRHALGLRIPIDLGVGGFIMVAPLFEEIGRGRSLSDGPMRAPGLVLVLTLALSACDAISFVALDEPRRFGIVSIRSLHDADPVATIRAEHRGFEDRVEVRVDGIPASIEDHGEGRWVHTAEFSVDSLRPVMEVGIGRSFP